MAGIVLSVELAASGDGSGYPLVKKLLLVAAGFTVPPLLWKYSTRNEPKEDTLDDRIFITWIGIILGCTAMGAGFVEVGKIKAAIVFYYSGVAVTAAPVILC